MSISRYVLGVTVTVEEPPDRKGPQSAAFAWCAQVQARVLAAEPRAVVEHLAPPRGSFHAREPGLQAAVRFSLPADAVASFAGGSMHRKAIRRLWAIVVHVYETTPWLAVTRG